MNDRQLNTRFSLQIFFLAATLVLAGIASLHAQPGPGEGSREVFPRRSNEPITMDALVLPSDRSDARRVDVLLLVSHDFMVFQRSGLTSPDSSFVGGVEVTVEHLDASGALQASRHTTARVSARDEKDRNGHVQLTFTFYVPQGAQTFTAEVVDLHSSRIRTLTRMVSLSPLEASPFHGSLFPVTRAADGRVSPLNLSSSFAYGTPMDVAVTMASGSYPPMTLRLLRHGQTKTDTLAIWPSHTPEFLPAGFTLPTRDSVLDEPSFGNYGAVGERLAVFSLGNPDLDPGEYLLELRREDGVVPDTLRQVLRVFWQAMPRSLRDPEFAIQMMRHILTDRERDSLRKGDSEDMERNLYNWWRHQESDPVKRRIRMHEYFRRVDEAIDRFRSVDISNGALSDRGKVFILYGPPDELRRDLDPRQYTMETWVYHEPELIFRFVDKEKKGRFRLIK